VSARPEAHLVAIYRKLGVSSSGRAVLAARQRGVLPGDQEATSAGSRRPAKRGR